MLFHDIAKPLMKTTDENGCDHFKKHAEKGETLAKGILRRLKFDNDTIDKVTRLVRWHDERPEPSMKAVRRAVNRIGEDIFPMYLVVRKADLLAQSTYRREEKLEHLMKVEECYNQIREEAQCVSMKSLAVSGRDLIQAGFKPGPEMGQLLNRMLDHVLEVPEDNTKEKLMAFIKE